MGTKKKAEEDDDDDDDDDGEGITNTTEKEGKNKGIHKKSRIRTDMKGQMLCCRCVVEWSSDHRE